MVKKIEKFECELTGKQFAKESDAVLSEHLTTAARKLEERTGITETEAVDVLLCIKQSPDIFKIVFE